MSGFGFGALAPAGANAPNAPSVRAATDMIATLAPKRLEGRPFQRDRAPNARFVPSGCIALPCPSCVETAGTILSVTFEDNCPWQCGTKRDERPTCFVDVSCDTAPVGSQLGPFLLKMHERA